MTDFFPSFGGTRASEKRFGVAEPFTLPELPVLPGMLRRVALLRCQRCEGYAVTSADIPEVTCGCGGAMQAGPSELFSEPTIQSFKIMLWRLAGGTKRNH